MSDYTHIQPQVPDSTVSTILRVDTSTTFTFDVPVETNLILPDSVANRPVKDTIQNSTSVKNESVVKDTSSKETEKKTEQAKEEVKQEKKEDKKTEDPILPKDTVAYNSDTIPYLYKETSNDLVFKKNFFLNFYAVQEDTAVNVKVESVEIKEAKKLYPVKKQNVTTTDENFRVAFSQDWILFVILGSLAIIAWTKLFYNKFISLIFKAAFNYQLSYKLFRENNSVYQRTSFLFNLNFVINIGLFGYLSLHFYSKFPETHNHFLYFLIISGIVAAFYLLKYVVYKILGFILKEENTTSEYLHNLLIYNKILGITLLPITVSIPYIDPIMHKPLIILGIMMYIIFFIMSIIRGFLITIRTNVSIFYLILYLCTLEILPIIILIKFLKTTI